MCRLAPTSLWWWHLWRFRRKAFRLDRTVWTIQLSKGFDVILCDLTYFWLSSDVLKRQWSAISHTLVDGLFFHKKNPLQHSVTHLPLINCLCGYNVWSWTPGILLLFLWHGVVHHNSFLLNGHLVQVYDAHTAKLLELQALRLCVANSWALVTFMFVCQKAFFCRLCSRLSQHCSSELWLQDYSWMHFGNCYTHPFTMHSMKSDMSWRCFVGLLQSRCSHSEVFEQRHSFRWLRQLLPLLRDHGMFPGTKAFFAAFRPLSGWEALRLGVSTVARNSKQPRSWTRVFRPLVQESWKRTGAAWQRCADCFACLY